MKKITFMLIALITFSVSAQKKKNGTVYVDHPAIDMVESFQNAWVSGDLDKAKSFLAEDFRIFNGVGLNKNAKGWTKTQFVGNMTWWVNNMDYFQIKRSEGAYPDAIEYKEGDQLWVQTWDHLYGVNKNTGAKFDAPVHRLYLISNDNKSIKAVQEYTNEASFINMRDSYAQRENGKIYINHENINTVRKLMYAFAYGDVDKAFSFFTKNATYIDSNESKGMNEEEIRARDAKLLSGWNITSLDESGYPDYLEYDWRDSKVVQSWWNFTMVRQSDDKKVVLPVFYLDDFDNDGKITQRNAYWNATLLK